MNDKKEIHKVSTTERVVAFTFDDGPHPIYTKQLLDIFRDAGGKATFFMIGEQIDAFEETAALVHAEGHEIGNHTYTHPFLTKITPEQALAELERSDERIRRITGEPVKSFRPPYFDADEGIYKLAEQLGYHSVGALNLEARDWEQPQPSVEYMAEQTRTTLDSGSIFIFHDGYGDRSRTVETVRVLVKELAAEGYRFVTASELLALADRGSA